MAEPVYSKRAVNRAGERLRASHSGSALPLDDPELDAAREIVEHWRGLHAVPLSKVAAGLRYYVRKAGADERSVSQRLKRFDTIIEKCQAAPKSVGGSASKDVGGVGPVEAVGGGSAGGRLS
jgi:hypothetical protein